MLAFQRPDARSTLSEAREEYFASRADLAQGRGLSPEAREFFRCHDTAHVVFGCGTRLPEEAVVKIWSFFGTTAGLGLMRAYRLPESKEIYERLGVAQVAWTTLLSLALVPITLWRCARMRKRWPWGDFARYEAVPLDEIRREFGIRVIAPVPATDSRADDLPKGR